MSKSLILILFEISTATDCKVNLLLHRSMEIFTEYGTGLGEIKKKLKTEMNRMKMKDLEKPNILMLELKAKTIWKHNRDLMRSPEEKLSDFNKSEETSEIDEQFEDEDYVYYDFQNDNVLFSYNMEFQKAKKFETARLVLLVNAHYWHGQKEKNRRAKNRIKLRIKK